MKNWVAKIRGLAVVTLFAVVFVLGCSEGRMAANPASRAKAVVSVVKGAEGKQVILTGSQGAAAVFEQSKTANKWVYYKDLTSHRSWTIGGEQFTIETPDGKVQGVGQTGFDAMTIDKSGRVVLSAKLTEVGVEVRRAFSFADDGRTLRMKTWIRSMGEPVAIRRIGLMELDIDGQNLQLMGNRLESFPVFGDQIWAGVEHYSAFCETDGAHMSIYRYHYEPLGREWLEVPSGVFGAASETDMARWDQKAVRRAFLRYLDTVRIKLEDLEIDGNNWWSVPFPFDEEIVLDNLAALKAGLYETTGLFFDTFTLDLGWSDPNSVWRIDTKKFPHKFDRIVKALEPLDCRLGLWVSPASAYPPGLNNQWLKDSGYEVIPVDSEWLNNAMACFAAGTRYQREFRDRVVGYARDYRLGHMKFDAWKPMCDDPSHGHPTGEESYRFTAEGMADVLEGLRREQPDIVTEPLSTCGYPGSPWWLTKTQVVLAGHGDDVPYGNCPSPDWIQSLISARDTFYTAGRDKWIMPSDALFSFDIVVQFEHDIEDLCVIAIGRGRWFISTYFNPRYMNEHKWKFFADLMRWARHNRQDLRNAEIIGGVPDKKESYGFAFYDNPDRQLFCVRNPWIEEGSIVLNELTTSKKARQVRALYPRREILANVAENEPLPHIELAPYEMLFIEVVPADHAPVNYQARRPKAAVSCAVTESVRIEALGYADAANAETAFQDSEGPDLKKAMGVSFTCDVEIADVHNAELCILLEGDPNVAHSQCVITVDGEEVPVRVMGTHDQFTASSYAQGDFWLWFVVPVEAGRHQAAVEIKTPLAKVRMGAYLRGRMDEGLPEASFGEGPRFPIYKANSRAWSKTVLPLTDLAVK